MLCKGYIFFLPVKPSVQLEDNGALSSYYRLVCSVRSCISAEGGETGSCPEAPSSASPQLCAHWARWAFRSELTQNELFTVSQSVKRNANFTPGHTEETSSCLCISVKVSTPSRYESACPGSSNLSGTDFSFIWRGRYWQPRAAWRGSRGCVTNFSRGNGRKHDS